MPFHVMPTSVGMTASSVRQCLPALVISMLNQTRPSCHTQRLG
jgi:hypothetical protein